MNGDELAFVAVVGSLRRGATSRAVAETLDELAPDEVTVSTSASIAAIPHYSEDRQDLGFPASVVSLSQDIGQADAIVIVTPEYNHSVPGTLKNALDWISRLPQQPFAGKAVAIQTVSPGPFGGVRAQGALREVLVSLGACILPRPEVAIPYAPGKIDASTARLSEEATRNHVAAQLAALSRLVRERRAFEAKRFSSP